MKEQVEIQIGYRYCLWVLFYLEQIGRGLQEDMIAGLSTFLRAWRKEDGALDWIHAM